MSNPIKAIIILKEGSGGGGDGQAGCCIFLIIGFIVLGNFLDWGFIPTSILCAIMFIAYLADKMAMVVISGLIIAGAMWGCVKLRDNDTTASDSNTDTETNSSALLEFTAIDLSEIKYPHSFQTISDLQLLNAEGEETVIPANTRILIMDRTSSGILKLEAGGKTYVGSESRLTGKVRE